jgi:histidinol-phosphate aminotransferase
VSDDELGPLLARVPEVLRGSSAYHVAQPPRVVAKLDANELPYGFPPELRHKLATALSEVALERYPDPNARRLRALLVERLNCEAGVNITGENIVFGNGSDEVIALLANAFPGPLLYPSPSFVYYKLAAIARGLPAVEVPLTDRFELDESALVASIASYHPSVVFLALPNNPTGTLWRPQIALELAARFRDTVIVSDEAYLAYAAVSNLGALREHPNLVVMRTFSKIGLAGMRVGYTIQSKAIAHVLEKVRPPYNVSSLDQRVAEFALEHAMDWCEAQAGHVVAERGRLAPALAAKGFDVFPSAANLLLVRVPAAGFAPSDGSAPLDAPALYAKLLAAGIVVRFFGTAGALAGCLRITVGTPVENDSLLNAL